MSEAAGSVNIVLSVNKANYTQAMNEAQRQLDRFAGKAKAAGHTTVSSMQATSAVLRAMHGGFEYNMRAVERFASQSKIAGQIAKTMFPVVGAATFGYMVIDLGMKVADFIKKTREMPNAISAGFASLNLAQKTATDQLQLTNDELQNAINKLQGKTQNNLAIEMDEARVAADKLAESIERSNNRLNDLLSKNHLTGWAILLGKAGSADREGTEKAFAGQADSNAYDLANATTPAQTAAALKALKDTQNAQLKEARSDLAKRTGANAPGQANQAANIAIDKGVITTILNQQKENAEELRNATLEAQNKKMEAAKAAAEAAKRADQQRLEAMKAALEAEKEQGALSLAQVFQYWADRKSAFTKGSAAYNDVVTMQTQAAIAAARQASEKIAKFLDATKHQPSAPLDPGRSVREFNAKGNDLQIQGYVDSNRTAIDDAHNDAKEKEAKVTEEAGHSITKYATALQLAKIHAQEYLTVETALLAILNMRIAQQKANPSPQNDRQVAQAQMEYSNAISSRDITAQRDMDAIYGKQTSAIDGTVDALHDFIEASRDSATQLRDFTDGALYAFNGQVIRGISGQRTSFSNMGADMFRNVAGIGLTKAEGGLMGAIGLGPKAKLGSSKGNAMWVQLADNLRSVPDVTGGLFSKARTITSPNTVLSAINGGDGSSGSSTGMSVASLAGIALKTLPMFASGGPVSPNTWAIVGEEGPELFHSGGGGSIIPNHKLTGGGGGDIHFHAGAIDARGATDPAQVHAAVQRGIRAAAPHIMAGAMRGMRENKLRRPSGRG